MVIRSPVTAIRSAPSAFVARTQLRTRAGGVKGPQWTSETWAIR
jgi:hypothetical protein